MRLVQLTWTEARSHSIPFGTAKLHGGMIERSDRAIVQSFSDWTETFDGVGCVNKHITVSARSKVLPWYLATPAFLPDPLKKPGPFVILLEINHVLFGGAVQPLLCD